MSVDYPNRAVWLAKRFTPSRVVTGVVLWARGTYSAGRTQAKARLWERRQAVKKARRAAKKAQQT